MLLRRLVWLRASVSLSSCIPAAWRIALAPAVASPSFAKLESFLDREWSTTVVLPPRPRLFAALDLTPPDAVRVVLLGQDPYPDAGNANGLAFSVARGMELPASLTNLFLGLHRELGVAIPKHGDLTAWALRGVLLLNTVLTVREGHPHSHANRGWEDFALAVLGHVAMQPWSVAFLCLGRPAQNLVRSLGTKQPIVEAPHPSPKNGTAFIDCAVSKRIFSRINQALDTSFDWSL